MTTFDENNPPATGDDDLANATLIGQQAELVTKIAEKVATLSDRVRRLETIVLGLTQKVELTDTPPE
jgi:hypothetical protein